MTTAKTKSELMLTEMSSTSHHAIDGLNQRYVRHCVSVGDVPKRTAKWQGTRNHTSPRYTTRWTELMKV